MFLYVCGCVCACVSGVAWGGTMSCGSLSMHSTAHQAKAAADLAGHQSAAQARQEAAVRAVSNELAAAKQQVALLTDRVEQLERQESAFTEAAQRRVRWWVAAVVTTCTVAAMQGR